MTWLIHVFWIVWGISVAIFVVGGAVVWTLNVRHWATSRKQIDNNNERR